MYVVPHLILLGLSSTTIDLFAIYKSVVYHIVQIFGRGKPWRIWQITGGSPNFNNVL